MEAFRAAPAARTLDAWKHSGPRSRAARTLLEKHSGPLPRPGRCVTDTPFPPLPSPQRLHPAGVTYGSEDMKESTRVEEELVVRNGDEASVKDSLLFL